MLEGARAKRWQSLTAALVLAVCVVGVCHAGPQSPSDPTFNAVRQGTEGSLAAIRKRGRNRDPWRSGSLSPVAGTVLAVEDPIDKTCPVNWVKYANNCYKFVRSPKKDKNDAKTMCQVRIIVQLK